jgi:uncharacterized membrane protein YkgB
MISLLNEAIDWLVKLLAKTGLFKKDLDYNLLRASMVVIFLLFGYQKWFIYERGSVFSGHSGRGSRSR